MAMCPEAQEKAQHELDMVVGPNALPSFDDIDELPYLRAVFLESTRWMPILPLGLAHAAYTEDEYNGFRIPKGAVIMPVCDCTTDVLRLAPSN